jgi:hypothetical protein
MIEDLKSQVLRNIEVSTIHAWLPHSRLCLGARVFRILLPLAVFLPIPMIHAWQKQCQPKGFTIDIYSLDSAGPGAFCWPVVCNMGTMDHALRFMMGRLCIFHVLCDQ